MNTAIVHACKQAHRHRHTQTHRHIQTDTYTRVQDDCVLARAHVLVSRCSRVSVLVSVLVRVCMLVHATVPCRPHLAKLPFAKPLHHLQMLVNELPWGDEDVCNQHLVVIIRVHEGEI